MSPTSMYPHTDHSTHSILLIKRVVLVFKDPHRVILPMKVTMQKWVTIFNMLIQDCQFIAV